MKMIDNNAIQLAIFLLCLKVVNKNPQMFTECVRGFCWAPLTDLAILFVVMKSKLTVPIFSHRCLLIRIVVSALMLIHAENLIGLLCVQSLY